MIELLPSFWCQADKVVSIYQQNPMEGAMPIIPIGSGLEGEGWKYKVGECKPWEVIVALCSEGIIHGARAGCFKTREEGERMVQDAVGKLKELKP